MSCLRTRTSRLGLFRYMKSGEATGLVKRQRSPILDKPEQRQPNVCSDRWHATASIDAPEERRERDTHNGIIVAIL